MSDTKPGQLTIPERAALIAPVAMARFEGLSEAKISAQLKISVRQVRNILQCDEYNVFLKELQDQALKHALSNFRRQLDSLAPLAVKALKANLEDNKIEGVKLWAQLVGGLKNEDKPDQQQNIQIVVPAGILTPEHK